jgi:hypothetical protein
MIAVGFDIGNIIEQIYRARDQGKQEKPRHRQEKIFEYEQTLVKDQTKKNETILGPLAWAHGFDEGFEHGTILPYPSKIDAASPPRLQGFLKGISDESFEPRSTQRSRRKSRKLRALCGAILQDRKPRR